jgi:hypothetical protein
MGANKVKEMDPHAKVAFSNLGGSRGGRGRDEQEEQGEEDDVKL